MSQRLLFYRISILLFVQLLFSTSLLYSQNNLQVDFTSTTTDTTIVYKGMKANFPYPVLSLLTIRDQNGRYIHGLADTSKWLAPADTNQLGDIVDDVWATIFEYHQDDNNLPPNPDVKAGDPSYLVREILDIEGFSTSMAMVMDYSGSMKDDIYVAEDGARNFFRQISPIDRVALIKFTGKIEVFQEFTSDTTLLMEALESPTSDRHVTAFYDAVYLGLEACETEPGRRVVIAYTDGNDNASGHSLNDVIEYAQDLDIPVYVIGLGLRADNTALSKLAQQTGGTYVTTTSVEDLQEIYEDIYEEVRGFYLLAHNSTDPDPNGTWRIVDLTMNYGGAQGRGIGRYYVPFIGPDLDVSKEVFSDNYLTPVSHAISGDTLSYKVSVFNHANGPANGVKIVDQLPDSINLIEVLPPPAVLSNDSLVWDINRMEIGDSLIITYKVLISNKLSLDTLLISNKVSAYNADDPNVSNNVVQTNVYAHGLSDASTRVNVPIKAYSPEYPAKLTGYITNQSEVDINYPFEVSFTINNNNVVAVDTVYFLASGDSILVEGIWESPSAGTYALEIFADYKRVIPETNENNNIDIKSIKVAIEDLNLQVSDVSLDETVFMRKATFPDEVLSTVSVVDQNTNPIKKLANASNWIGMSENNEINVQAGQTWQSMREFHRDEPAVPTDPNVKSGLEVIERNGQAFSLGFMVDYSENMSWIVKPVSHFIENWTRSDGGSVTSAKTASILQPFTQDPGSIKNAINSTYSESTRRVFDGLYYAINSVANQEGRNAVLGLVGDADNGSNYSAKKIAERALNKGVPIHIVQLGAVAADSLRWLTDITGGWYWLVKNTSEFEEVMDSFERILRNYYVTAHTSSDTLMNDTWRAIDLTMLAYNFTDNDTGFYHTPLGFSDISLMKTAYSYHATIIGQDTIYQASPGDTVYYTVQVSNTGHYVISQVDISDVLPYGLQLIDATPAVYRTSNDSLFWRLANLGVGASRTIDYHCLVDTLRLPNSFYMVNQAFIDFPEDTVFENNISQDSVLFVPLAPADLQILKSVKGDSVVVQGQDTTWYSHPGDTIQYTLHIMNIGTLNARDIVVQDILPEYVSYIDAAPIPNSISEDTLEWEIPLIAGSNGSHQIKYTCRIDTSMPPWKVSLVNHALISSPDDTLNNNNNVQDTLWVTGLIPPGPEVIADPELVSPGDSVDITVMAPYEVESWDIVIIYEDGTRITTYGDDFIQNNALIPSVSTLILPSFGNTYFTVPKLEEVVTVIFVTTDEWGVQRSDTTYFRIGATDLDVDKAVITDSLTITNNDTTYWGQPKDTVHYELIIKNTGLHTAYNIDVNDTFSSGLTYLSSTLTPVQVVGNTIEWHLDSIQVGLSQSIKYNCIIDTIRIANSINLTNLATISCPEDTIINNNTASDTLIYIPLTPVDLTVLKTGVGDSLVVSGNDSIWFVHPGKTVQYTITVKNIGQIVCQGAEISDILPNYLTFVSSSPSLSRQNGDSLFWQIGKVPERGGARTIQYTCRVDSSMPSYSVLLINHVMSLCPEDTLNNNDTTADTVWVIGIKPPGPTIMLNPILIAPTDTVNVQVMSPIDVVSWDLEVIYADETISKDYGDSFISSNLLMANNWLTVQPPFDDTEMKLNKSSETVCVVLKTTDSWGLVQTDTASFQIQSADQFYLDRNVYKPHESPIQIRVQLSSNRDASLAIYDISGDKYYQLVDDEFLLAGWHYYNWDGNDESGNPAGSGIYVVILHSGSYNKALKFILVR